MVGGIDGNKLRLRKNSSAFWRSSEIDLMMFGTKIKYINSITMSLRQSSGLFLENLWPLRILKKIVKKSYRLIVQLNLSI
jgi:hypothetical protein